MFTILLSGKYSKKKIVEGYAGKYTIKNKVLYYKNRPLCIINKECTVYYNMLYIHEGGYIEEYTIKRKKYKIKVDIHYDYLFKREYDNNSSINYCINSINNSDTFINNGIFTSINININTITNINNNILIYSLGNINVYRCIDHSPILHISYWNNIIYMKYHDIVVTQYTYDIIYKFNIEYTSNSNKGNDTEDKHIEYTNNKDVNIIANTNSNIPNNNNKDKYIEYINNIETNNINSNKNTNNTTIYPNNKDIYNISYYSINKFPVSIYKMYIIISIFYNININILNKELESFIYDLFMNNKQENNLIKDLIKRIHKLKIQKQASNKLIQNICSTSNLPNKSYLIINKILVNVYRKVNKDIIPLDYTELGVLDLKKIVLNKPDILFIYLEKCIVETKEYEIRRICKVIEWSKELVEWLFNNNCINILEKKFNIKRSNLGCIEECYMKSSINKDNSNRCK